MTKDTSFFKKLIKPVDLTKGKPWKVLLLYGAPIMLSYFLQQIYVLTDAIICGQTLTAGQVAGVTLMKPKRAGRSRIDNTVKIAEMITER